jgi:hypothetical protein
MQASGLVTRQINHDGDGPIDPHPAGPPNMLIHPNGFHTGQSGRVAGADFRLDLDGVPGGVPVHTQMAGQRRDRRVIVGQSVGGPTYGSHREHRARRGDVVGFAEHPDRARRLPAAPHPFQPPHHRDPAQAGSIVQHSGAAAVAGRNHPARRAAGFDLIRLHRHDQPAVTIIPNVEHVHARNIKDRIGSGAPAHTRATHRVGHRRVLRGTGAWSPLILKVPTPLLGHQHAASRHGHTTVNSEDPGNHTSEQGVPH